MWCMFPRTIHGWFTDIPSWRGRDGIRIPGSGLADRTSRLGSALESGGGADLDGDGDTGDSTGTTITQCLTTVGITPRSRTFYNRGSISIVAETHGAAAFNRPCSTRGRRPGLSMETGRRLEDTLHLAVRAASARARSAATTTADRPGAFRRAEAPALAEEDFTAEAEVFRVAVADGGNRSSAGFPASENISKWREAICGERS